MCLGVPMTVQAIAPDGFIAKCSAEGVEREVNLMLLYGEPVAPGDHVLVHLGNAVRTLTAEEFEQTWDYLRSSDIAASS